MSIHTFIDTYSGRPIEISIGWDRPLQGYFMFIEYLDDSESDEGEEGPLWSSLDQDPSHPKIIDPFLDVLCQLQIGIPMEMVAEIKADGMHNTGNKEVAHFFDQDGLYCRIEGQ